MLPSVQGLISSRSRMMTLFPIAQKIFAFVVSAPRWRENLEGVKPIEFNSLKVDDVSFEYVENKPVLSGVSVEFKKGEITGLIGLSGSGKTTLLDLIARFQKPDSGRITLDSKEIREFQLMNYRSCLGYVAQEPILLNTTAWENITAYRNNASPQEVEKACRLAHAHEFLEKKENGYQAKVGERGALFSGGERQRLILSRVFLADPPVLVLDEATSALDVDTEKKIFDELHTMKKNKMIVIVAHRLSSIKNFDKIVVMDKGKLLEQGTHEELLKKNGVYARLYQLQSMSTSETQLTAQDRLLELGG